MLRQIHIDNFSKIITNYKSQIFNTLTIIQSKPYNQSVQHYLGISVFNSAYDHHDNMYQMYTTDKELQPILKDIQFIQKSPNILLLKTQKDHIIIEEKISQNLYETLLMQENKNSPTPYLEQTLARAVVLQLKAGIDNYSAHGIDYNAINPKNIVRRKLEWELSLTGLLLKNQKLSNDYYKKDIKPQYATSYALGTLLFKLLFGFVPFQKRKERTSFNFKEYLKQLDKEQTKKALKIYYFADRLLQISQSAKKLIEIALGGDMSIEQFYGHEYFNRDTHLGARKQIHPANRQIKMLSLFNKHQQSLVMAAIEHHRKYPQQRINSKLIFAHQLEKQEIINHLSKHPVLCQVQFDQSFKQSKIKQNSKYPIKSIPKVNLEYFYRQEQFDPETDYPCRDLIKIIQNYKRQWESQSEQLVEKRQAAIKLYAYPYAMVFQLLKAAQNQPEEIISKISKLIQDLLQISQLKFTKLIDPLHQTQLIIRSFQDIKLSFRQKINYIYKHFLNQAIKKYNVKKDIVQYAQRIKYKKLGLQYYKLCLKLMECSLLIRKEGRDLDLNRIETSQRKEIESDLNQLLKQYFPNKIELN